MSSLYTLFIQLEQKIVIIFLLNSFPFIIYFFPSKFSLLQFYISSCRDEYSEIETFLQFLFLLERGRRVKEKHFRTENDPEEPSESV